MIYIHTYDDQLARIRLITETIQRTVRVPWVFVPGSIQSTSLGAYPIKFAMRDSGESETTRLCFRV